MENKFTKNNTLAIKGLAIFLLVAYHCLSSEQRLFGASINFWPLSQTTAMRIFLCMETCVGLFVFLSVYGMTLSVKKQYMNFEFTPHEGMVFTVKRYVHLVFTFLLPYIFCAGVTSYLGMSRYRGGTYEKMIARLADILCVGNIFRIGKLIETWWYLSLEVVLIVFLPVMIKLYKKCGWLLVVMCLLPGSFVFLEGDERMIKYLLLFPLAICFADNHVLERLKAFCIVKSFWLNKILKFVILTVITLLTYKIFLAEWGLTHFKLLLNGILPILVIWWAYEFLICIPGISHVLEFFGKHSADIFYVHTFIRAMWLKKMTYSFEYAWQVWLFVLMVSLGISLFLDGIRKLTHYNQITGKFVKRIVSWCDRALYSLTAG